MVQTNDVTAARELVDNFIAADWNSSYVRDDGAVRTACITPCCHLGRLLTWVLARDTAKQLFFSNAEEGIKKIQEAFNVVFLSDKSLSADQKYTLSQKITAKIGELDAKVYKDKDRPFRESLGMTPTPPPASSNQNPSPVEGEESASSEEETVEKNPVPPTNNNNNSIEKVPTEEQRPVEKAPKKGNKKRGGMKKNQGVKPLELNTRDKPLEKLFEEPSKK